ncbi:glycerate kinase [Caldalkalibacillus thermarum]|uniref:glycerate kinase n=1 Tax=Caldalkalibacillus thermarum TaxID=296745 RepID=UPI0016673499|nr:glycerate kinase [Caldalkalibacillus thermarum]GGK20356.1 glycerate kinase [Caldalkalibacillus thermarum]
MSMHIVLAPDSFKGSMSSMEAAHMMAKGIREVLPDAQVTTVPVADGGEGTVDAVLMSTGGEKITLPVEDPLGRTVEAAYGWLPDSHTAVIEMAEPSGLNRLAPNERDPYTASTYGTGQLIKDALDRGARHLIIGLGGSATVDGGVGCLQALGLKCFDQHGRLLKRVGGKLDRIARIDISELDPRLQQVKTTIAADVTNPLLGPEGAVYVFGPQKGVQKKDLAYFEQGMALFAEVVAETTGKRLHNEPGSGAAGGFGFSLLTFFQAEMKSGIELILEVCHFESHVRSADLVITGEGKLDAQSLFGKGPIGIARLAKKHEVPCIALAGTVEGDPVQAREEGLLLMIPIVDQPMTLEEAMAQGPKLIYRASKRLMETLKLGKTLL